MTSTSLPLAPNLAKDTNVKNADALRFIDKSLAVLSTVALVGGMSMAMLLLLAMPGQPLDGLFSFSQCGLAG